MLSQENNVIEKLKAKPEFAEISKLKCFVKSENDFNMYFFAYYAESTDELAKKEEIVRDFIAIYFQGLTVEKDVERWNIYIFFFVQGEVNQDLKYKIEQDKYSSRKIIIDKLEGEPDDAKIIELINSELFVEVFSAVEQPDSEAGLLEKFEEKYKDIIEYINSKDDTSPKDNINELIEKFGHE